LSSEDKLNEIKKITSKIVAMAGDGLMMRQLAQAT
jgi:hypothetical protein